MGMHLSPEMTARVIGMSSGGSATALPPAPTVSEKDFMADVIRLAKRLGWKVYHTHNSRKSEAGYPDLTLVRHKVIVAELKVGKGELTAAQSSCLEAFRSAGTPAYEWRPEDWERIVAVLSSTS